MTAETLTLTAAAAAALARPLGYTIRREPEAGEIVAYAKGTGKNAPAAYFTDCPIDALATVCAMAADSADPEALAAAHAACGVPMTHREEAQPEARESFTIDATPTWASLAPAFVMALQNGTPEGQKIAREEMARGFAALDAHNAAAAKATPAVPEDRREDLSQCLDRASYGNLRAFAFSVLAHGQDAAESAEDNLPHFAKHFR